MPVYRMPASHKPTAFPPHRVMYARHVSCVFPNSSPLLTTSTCPEPPRPEVPRYPTASVQSPNTHSARILQGAEAALFREALGTVVDMVRDDNKSVWQFDARLVPSLAIAGNRA